MRPEVRVARRPGTRGFTLIEMAVVVAIAAVLAALAYTALRRANPRARLAGLGTELHAMLHGARQEALARGRDVAVLFYPAAANGPGTGRVFVLADEQGGFLLGAAPPGLPDFCTMAPASPSGQVIATLDLPPGFTLSAPARAQAFPFPWNLVPAPAGGCSFCSTGATAQGAVRFDAQGKATFYSTCGAVLAIVNGGSVAITHAELGGSRVTVILPNGGVRTFSVE
jgi:prepilin-type N-terminal cleavage/methylation domain-containing protein